MNKSIQPSCHNQIAFHAAVDDWLVQAGRGGDIYEMGIKRPSWRSWPGQRLCRVRCNTLARRRSAAAETAEPKESHKTAAAKGHGIGLMLEPLALRTGFKNRFREGSTKKGRPYEE
jgi:hypothetical protein